MKHLYLTLLAVVCFFSNSSAKDGYDIKYKFKDLKEGSAYLAFYYAKPLPTIYKIDSTSIDQNGVAHFTKDEKILGGIYLIVFNDNKSYFELLLNNGDKLEATVDTGALPNFGINYKKDSETKAFQEYMAYLGRIGKKTQEFEAEYANAKTAKDTADVRKKYTDLNKELNDFRKSYIKDHPNSLMSKVFSAIKKPEVPEGPHYLEDGKTVDSNFGYTYYKEHFWDGFDLQDDRLIHTPIYDAKLQEYFSKLVLPAPDSVKYEADKLLEKTRGTEELFKYTLSFLTDFSQESKVMGMDEVFVYLVENYHMKGDATWMSSETLEKFIKRAREIAPNVIGNIAPNVTMQDMAGNEKSLYDVDAPYTLLVFWSPDCGHCKKEIPQLDSVYNAVLKDKGVKVYAVNVDNDTTRWKDMLDKNDLNDWVNVYEPVRKSRYKSQYDVYVTPRIYMLDEKKIIIGKRLDHTNVERLLTIHEEKKKASASK